MLELRDYRRPETKVTVEKSSFLASILCNANAKPPKGLEQFPDHVIGDVSMRAVGMPAPDQHLYSYRLLTAQGWQLRLVFC